MIGSGIVFRSLLIQMPHDLSGTVLLRHFAHVWKCSKGETEHDPFHSKQYMKPFMCIGSAVVVVVVVAGKSQYFMSYDSPDCLDPFSVPKLTFCATCVAYRSEGFPVWQLVGDLVAAIY